jgi:hypothetical protein
MLCKWSFLANLEPTYPKPLVPTQVENGLIKKSFDTAKFVIDLPRIQIFNSKSPKNWH